MQIHVIVSVDILNNSISDYFMFTQKVTTTLFKEMTLVAKFDISPDLRRALIKAVRTPFSKTGSSPVIASGSVFGRRFINATLNMICNQNYKAGPADLVSLSPVVLLFYIIDGSCGT